MDSSSQVQNSISTSKNTPDFKWRRIDDVTLEPSPSPSESTVAPSSAPSSSSSGFFYVLVILIAIPIVALIIYRLYKRYQRRYEQQMLDYRSRQADRVLGDMQMIPTEDLDRHHDNDHFDDNELI
jgi:flagellar biosynthesis/type III secretory pathway M-ring protein FliF/YscJ